MRQIYEYGETPTPYMYKISGVLADVCWGREGGGGLLSLVIRVDESKVAHIVLEKVRKTARRYIFLPSTSSSSMNLGNGLSLPYLQHVIYPANQPTRVQELGA